MGEAWRSGGAVGNLTTNDTKHTKGGEGLSRGWARMGADGREWARMGANGRKRKMIGTSVRGMKPTGGRFYGFGKYPAARRTVAAWRRAVCSRSRL